MARVRTDNSTDVATMSRTSCECVSHEIVRTKACISDGDALRLVQHIPAFGVFGTPLGDGGSS